MARYFSIYWLLILTPICIAIKSIPDVSQPLVFFLAAAAIIPIAKLLVEATEHLAHRFGDSVGGLLNATFGNAPELIICVSALRAGYHDMVRGSLIGGILVNLLFAQGLSFLLGGLRYKDQEFNSAGTRTYGTMMLIAVMCLSIPSAFARAVPGVQAENALSELNIIVAMLLLLTYGLYLLFILKTHPNYFVTQAKESGLATAHGSVWSANRAFGMLLVASVLAAVMSEVLVGAAEVTGHELGLSQTFLGVIVLAAVGGVAEIAAAVSTARSNRMDLSIGISLGSSIQIALFVAPTLVLLSFIMAEKPLQLTFGTQSLALLFVSVLLGAFVTSDGRSNWYKGAQLIIVYVLLGAMLFMIPAAG